MKWLSAILLSLLLTCAARAQGYISFTDIPGIGHEPSVQIDLNPQILRFLGAASEGSGDAEAAALLSGIENVRVQVYEELDDREAVVDFVDDTSGELESDGWQRAVFIQDDEQNRVRMYLRLDEERVSGMTVMIVDESEAVFINIAGTIDPVVLGQLTRRLGIDQVMNNVGGGVVPELPDVGNGAARGSDDTTN